MICDAGDVVLVGFPYVDQAVLKRRPALVLTTAARNQEAGETLLAMITTAKGSAWSDDVPLHDLADAGLRQPCVLRPRLQTITNVQIERPLGQLSQADRARARAGLSGLIAL